MTAIDKIAHKPTRLIMQALRDGGWQQIARPFPGSVIFGHPLSGTELPTPDYMRGTTAWPFETFYRLRQVHFNFEGERISAVWARTCTAPWVRVRMVRIPFSRAVDFIREDWTP